MGGRAFGFAARTLSSWPIRIQSIVGPTGRGITGEIVTYTHPDDRPLPKAKGSRSRDGRTLLPIASMTRSSSTGPASTRSTTSS